MSETKHKLEKDALDGLHAVAKVAKEHVPDDYGVSVVWFSKKEDHAGTVTIGDKRQAIVALRHLADNFARTLPKGMVVFAPDGTKH